jgi:hypothetical protein
VGSTCPRSHCPPPLRGQPAAAQIRSRRIRHEVLAPSHRRRAEVTPAGRGRGKSGTAQTEKPAIERHAAMTWAERLKLLGGLASQRSGGLGSSRRIDVPASEVEPLFRGEVFSAVRTQSWCQTPADHESVKI